MNHEKLIIKTFALLIVVGALVQTGFCQAADKKVDALFETAMSAYRLERWEDAVNKFYDFMAADPYDPRNDQAQYYAARAIMHRKYLNKAIEEFGYVIEDFPESDFRTLALHDRSECYLKTRKTAEAIEDKESVTKIPVKIYHGDKDAMLRQLYENHRADVFWLAEYYQKEKQPEKEIAVFQRLPHPIDAFRHVVNVYYRLGQYDKIRDLIDTLQAEHKHEGYKFLIEFYGKSKAYNQLKGVFSKLLQEKNADRGTDDLVWTTAWSFNNFGGEQWEWAMKQVSAHYPRMARNADFELAKRKWQDKNYMDELELFVIKYKSGNDVNAVLLWKGIMYERLEEPEKARETYRRMNDPAIGHWYAAQTYDGPHAKKKDLDGAVEEYTKMRKAYYSPEWSALAQWHVAEILRSQKKIDEAVEAYRHVAQRFASVKVKDKRYGWHHYWVNHPNREYGPDAQLAVGDVLRETKRFDDAIMEYRIVLSKYKKTEQAAWAGYNMALCYEGLGDGEMAVKVMKSVLRRYPKTKAASESHTRLEVKYKIEDVEVSDDAIDVLDQTDEEDQNYLENPEKMYDDRN